MWTPQEDRTRSVTHAVVLLLLLGIMACRGTRPVTNTHPAPQSTLTPAPHVDTTAHQRPVPAPPAVVAAAPSRPYHLPAIPMTAADAKLALRVEYPTADMPRPVVDSNFIFGSTGNGYATLAINGHAVPVAPNGAFLAYLPLPKDGRYHLTARHGADTASTNIEYRPARTPVAGEAARVATEHFAPPRVMVVVKGSDTVQTGNDVAAGALTPDGERQWFFPRGARLEVIAHHGAYYRVLLGEQAEAWVADSNLAPASAEPLHQREAVTHDAVTLEAHDRFIDLRLPMSHDPFLVTAEGNALRVTIYANGDHGHPTPDGAITTNADPLMDGLHVRGLTQAHTTEYHIRLHAAVWGYKTFYDGAGALVLRVRRPPVIDTASPLHSLKILLDPGHPPGGAIGPTGLMEREANLSLALALRRELVARGAIVQMTHETLDGLVSSTDQLTELGARSMLAVRSEADLFISTHNNAFPDGTDPFLNNGTGVYYFQPISAELARALDREIVQVTTIPDNGAQHKSLAVCRPTWLPCVLTESMVMMFPEQENALRQPELITELARAHARGLEAFLRSRATGR